MFKQFFTVLALLGLSACGDFDLSIRNRPQELSRDPHRSLEYVFVALDDYFANPTSYHLDEVNVQLQMISDVVYEETGRRFPIPTSLSAAIYDETIYPGDTTAYRLDGEILLVKGSAFITTGDESLVLALGNVVWDRMGVDNVVIARGNISLGEGDPVGSSLVMSGIGAIHIDYAEHTTFYTQGSYDVQGGYRLPTWLFSSLFY